MARKMRVEFDGAIYHVMCRGDRRQAIFLYTKGSGRPGWLETRVVLGELGWQDNPSGRSKYGRRMEARAREGEQDNDGDLESLRTGWCLGSEAFKQRMLDRLEAVLRGKEDGKLRAAHSDHDHAALRAGRLLECGLREFGLEAEALTRMKKSDWRKRVIGWLIRRQTTVPLRWIADHLKMGAVSRVSRLCGDISDLGPDAHRHSLRIEKMSRSKA